VKKAKAAESAVPALIYAISDLLVHVLYSEIERKFYLCMCCIAR